jgi:hypothetical protein
LALDTQHIRFLGYRLDPAARALTAPDGSDIALGGRAFDVPAYAIEHRAGPRPQRRRRDRAQPPEPGVADLLLLQGQERVLHGRAGARAEPDLRTPAPAAKGRFARCL